jgi:hypothetical protein
MQASNASTPLCTSAQSTSNDIGALFPGSQLSHVLHVVTEPNVAAVSSVIECLESDVSSGIDIQSFHVRRLPDAFDQRICVQGIDETHARHIRARLERLQAVARVRLEHQVRVTHGAA